MGLAAISAGAAYAAACDQLVADYAALPPGASIRLAKPTSNLFRARTPAQTAPLDVSGFRHVIDIDPISRTADVGGMTTYQDLVDATLAHGLMPLVVPQLKTITLGGAVTGLGIEASSFRNGCPHESVLEMDVLTPDGHVITVDPTGEHSDLFFGFPNSYGTLGYALRLRIELEPVKTHVHLTHERHHDRAAFASRLAEVCAAQSMDGLLVDFVDGTVFSPSELYLTVGRFTDTVPYVSDYTGEKIFYRSMQHRHTDYLTTHDFLWRWDTDWFWCSRVFGVQRPSIRRIVPKRYLRSDVYGRIVRFERRHQVAARVDRWRGRPAREAVVQDVEVPMDRLTEFLEFLDSTTGIAPVWVCPLKQRDAGRTWDLYPLDSLITYANVGFWSSVPIAAGEADGSHNRAIERKVAELGGRKSLYSTSYFEPDEFWRTYGGARYDVLKKTYDPESRLLDLYTKCVRGG